MIETFIAPRRLFATFRDQAPWLGALIVVTLVAVVATSAIPDQAFVEQTRGATDRLGRPVTVTSDAATIGHWGRLLAAFSALVFQPMLAFGLAGVLTLIFMRSAQRVHYPQYLAVTVHAMLIPALGTLLVLPFRFREFAGWGVTLVQFVFVAWGVAVALVGARALHSTRPET